VVSQCEGGARAAGRDFEFIYYFFPKFVRAYSLAAASQDDCFEKFAEIQFTTTDGGDFEIVNPEIFLELDDFVSEVIAFGRLILFIVELEERW
jgi:hypothetical protein